MITAQPSLFTLPVEALAQFAELAREVGFPRDLKGQPMPVYLRNETDQPLRALRQHAQFDALLARYERGRFDRAHTGLIKIHAQIFPEENMRNQEFHMGLDRMLCHLQHRAQRGAVIEATDALDQLLFASDLHDSLPLRLFALPFPALYLHCSPHAAQALTVQKDGHPIQVEGIYCFAGEGDVALGTQRAINLIVLLNQDGMSAGSVKITLNLTDGEDTLLSYFASFQKTIAPEVWQWNMEIIGYVAKISLYMGLKEARVIRDDAYTAQQERLRRVGGKKQGKLAHDPQNSLRKLMFIAPVLVAAEQLADEREAPAPKRYGVTAK